MKHSRLAVITCATALLAVGAASAQGLSTTAVPAEFPPASFEGRQYVDSTGCVFVRAGVSGNVTWVPRVTRDRKHVCGAEPTFSRSAAAAPAAPAAQPSVQSATPSATRETATAPRSTARTAPVTAPVTAAAPVAAPRPSTTAIRITQPDPARSACQNASGVSAAYTVQHNGSPVRCGPQAASHVTQADPKSARSVAKRQQRTVPPPGTVVTRDMVPPRTRVAPARVYAEQQISTVGIKVPAGMQPVWDDDRLNPRRAHQTFEGMDQMQAMWTNTVPRRLVERRVAIGPATATAANASGPQNATPQRTSSTATLSTRSGPEPASHRYAQAGIFADAEQARAAAQQIARAGLPARRGTLTRDGRALTLVLAGPFATQAQLSDGAGRLRAMGFANVRLRK